jgi:MFS family permease
VTSALARARGALHSRDFRSLLAARLTSQFADGVFQAYLVDTIVFLSPEKQGTVVGVAKAFAVLVIPFSLVGPFTGVVIDRWSRRRILVVTPWIRAIVAAGLLGFSAGKTGALVYTLALVVVSADRFYLATAGAVMPSLVPDEDLLVGNSLAGATGTIVTFLGLVVGTQVAGPIGARPLLAACVVAWPLASFAARRIRNPLRALRPGADMATEVRRAFAELARGVRRLAATPAALGPIVSVSLDQFLIGLVTVLSVVVFKQEFKQGLASYGRILGAGGVGVLLGTITVSWLEERLSKPRIMAVSFALAGVVTLAGSPKIVAPVILVISFTLGLTFPWRKVPADTMVQESIPDRFRGRVFALYDLAFSLPRVVAAGLAILLVPHLSANWIVAVAGFVYLVWTPVTPRWVRAHRWAEVRFYAGGRADQVPRSMVIGGEEEPVQLIGSWDEDRSGVRLRRLRVRTQSGSTLDLTGESNASRWMIEREIASGGSAQ